MWLFELVQMRKYSRVDYINFVEDSYQKIYLVHS